MECHKCKVKLRVTRTVTAGPAGRTQEAECSECGGKFTCVTFVHPAQGYGTGAEAAAQKLKKGQLTLKTNDGNSAR